MTDATGVVSLLLLVMLRTQKSLAPRLDGEYKTQTNGSSGEAGERGDTQRGHVD